MSEIKVNQRLLGLRNVNVHVEDSGGNGRPVVLIHGWPLSGKSWKKQIPDFTAAGYRVITYDRRGFGESDKPSTGYSYDTLSDDLSGLLGALDLNDATLVGFSMGGGEVARYIARHGESRLRSIVFAAAVPPKMMKSSNNPEGPLDMGKASRMTASLTADSEKFYDQFTKEFFSPHAEGEIVVSESERQEAISLCRQASKLAALEAMQAFSFADFREDLPQITIPTLVIHGDADGIVPYEGSGKLTHQRVSHSELYIIQGGPHGINVSHSEEFNRVILDFIGRN